MQRPLGQLPFLGLDRYCIIKYGCLSYPMVYEFDDGLEKEEKNPASTVYIFFSLMMQHSLTALRLQFLTISFQHVITLQFKYFLKDPVKYDVMYQVLLCLLQIDSFRQRNESSLSLIWLDRALQIWTSYLNNQWFVFVISILPARQYLTISNFLSLIVEANGQDFGCFGSV